MPLKYSNSMSINDSMFAKRAIAFAISSIFAAGDVGAVYEPWDLSTLFKDSTGLIPATVNNEVGLMLDKSKGLGFGTEKITDGAFNDAVNWSAGTGWTVSGGVATRIAGTAASLEQTGRSFSANTWYQIEFDVSGFSGTGGITPTIAGVQTNSGPLITGNGHKKCLILSTAANTTLILTANSGVNCVIDNVSVKESLGNHAYQTVTARKPILRQDANGFYYLEHDGLDDYMVTGNVFSIANDLVIISAYTYNATTGTNHWGVFGPYKDTVNYIYLSQRPASAHIHSASARSNTFALLPVTTAGATNSTSPNTPLVAHARLIADTLYTGKNNEPEVSPVGFAMGSNLITQVPLRINPSGSIDLKFYGGLYRQKDLTVEERANVISYFAQHAIA